MKKTTLALIAISMFAFSAVSFGAETKDLGFSNTICKNMDKSGRKVTKKKPVEPKNEGEVVRLPAKTAVRK